MPVTDKQLEALRLVEAADGRRVRPHQSWSSQANNLSRKGLLYFAGNDKTGCATYKLSDAGRTELAAAVTLPNGNNQ